MANVTAAIEAIDLSTYNGEDPCLIHESACQYCHATRTQKPLMRCSTCSAVWYCSEDCVEADSERHRQNCEKIQSSKTIMEAREVEIRDQHQISDPIVPRQSIHEAARRAHKDLGYAMSRFAKSACFLARQGDTKELWETRLDLCQKLFRMSEPRSSSSLHEAANVSYALIHLNRLEDAWRYIRNTMVTFKSEARSQVVIEYEADDRYTDCLEWVRASYPLTTENEDLHYGFHRLIVGLVIIKLRIRVAESRNAWKDTINKTFLKTKRGQELEPVKYILEEYFSLSDDTFQLEQIRELIGILHYFDSKDPPIIPTLLKYSRQYSFLALHRTPNGLELVSTIVNFEGFTDWVANNEPLVATQNAHVAKERMSHVKSCARMILCGLIVPTCFGNASEQETSKLIGYGLVFSVSTLTIHTFLSAVAAIILPKKSFTRSTDLAIFGGVFMVVAATMVLNTHDTIEFMADGRMWDMMLLLAITNLFLWWRAVPSTAILSLSKRVGNELARN